MRYVAKKLTVGVAFITLSACASNGDGRGDRVLRGAGIGAAGGAVAGAIIPGLSVGEGALIGGAGGAVVGALERDRYGRQWYRDERGNEYYINRNGRRVYR
jgi:hypothetical protein